MLMEHGREKQGYKVLVVDDEDHIRRILKFQLEKHGYRVVLAENGEVALELMRRESPDLVILDLMMPKIDGLETCQRIRKNFQTSQIPIIMLTAKSELPDKIKGLQDGANDYLIKPYSSEELLLRVRNVLDWSFRQKEANPLTGLPGNRAIEKELQVRIEGQEPFAFLYLDIDNFKPYNDHYGYQKGDEAILFLSDIVTEAVNSLGGGSDFVGHIGGDDFVVITSPARGEFIGRHIIDQFDKGSLILFRDDDLQRGFMEIRNRLGEIKRMPLMSLTIALVVDEEGTLKHYAQVNDIASELKQYGKRMAGSVVVRERRKESASAQKVKS
jgi:CheY-like chemotaxis protein